MDYNFDDPVWKSISPEAQDFVSKLLVDDQSKRMTYAQILEHPWI